MRASTRTVGNSSVGLTLNLSSVLIRPEVEDQGLEGSDCCACIRKGVSFELLICIRDLKVLCGGVIRPEVEDHGFEGSDCCARMNRCGHVLSCQGPNRLH